MQSIRTRQPRPKAPTPPRQAYCSTLGDACREAGLDAHGMRCPACPLKVLCMTETRWRVPRTPRPALLV